ncbi:MAG: UDP-N-acetylmuramoyl-L-alanyl-D-glutamate--2,6-diaminopimelate ligase [Pseudohongiellaceae bacterium]|jgi:UDP-N-acetylmuramoyl-L-alanyl-D-glutamate--2,6-diaminopimelate ligase
MNTAETLNLKIALAELLGGMVDVSDSVRDLPPVMIAGVQLDSRLLNSGDLFLACFGKNHDARDFIDEAINRGVAAVFAESGGQWQGVRIIKDTPVIAIDNLSAKLSEIASRFYEHPSKKLKVIGITGTNGKTSCSLFIAQALAEMGRRCGVIGTLGYGIHGELKETQLTTPDAVFSQMALAQMVEQNVDPVVMEVSSVGLHQKRVEAVNFDIAIFTNLSRDHLDYHSSMEDYGECKKKLFTVNGLRSAVVNLDDPYALSIINSICNKVDISTFSFSNKIATVYASELEFLRDGYKARIFTPLGQGVIRGQLLGSFNFSNLLAVIATLISYIPKTDGFTIDSLCNVVSSLKPVTGRMEIVGDVIGDITAVVDYAHTPDGLKSALVALREHFTGNVWCVFGCGGNRDKGKRPLMGEFAECYADHIVICDDNPRKEDGDEIINHIMSGIELRSNVTIERDRAKAISFAVSAAKPGDVVLVAGKGHEAYQEVAGEKMLFSDTNHVRLALAARAEKKL